MSKTGARVLNVPGGSDELLLYRTYLVDRSGVAPQGDA
jgi:hypothetical protein